MNGPWIEGRNTAGTGWVHIASIGGQNNCYIGNNAAWVEINGGNPTNQGQVLLNATTSNWITWSAAGINPPAFTTRSAGTKLVLYPNITSTTVDFAIGIQSSSMWFSVESTGAVFYWYGGTTVAMNLSGNGNLGVTGWVVGNTLYSNNPTYSAVYHQINGVNQWSTGTGSAGTWVVNKEGTSAGTKLSIDAGGNVNANNFYCTGTNGAYGINPRDSGANQWLMYSSQGQANLNWLKFWNGTDRGGWRADGHFGPLADNITWCGFDFGSAAWTAVCSYSFPAASDPAAKRDIQPLPGRALDTIERLAPIEFRWKQSPDGGKRHNGFSAVDVHEVFGADHGAWMGSTLDPDTPISVCYNELTAVLWRAVQELSAEVVALKARLSS
jgi:hypothetical protein